jgi:hypothetical protein
LVVAVDVDVEVAVVEEGSMVEVVEEVADMVVVDMTTVMAAAAADGIAGKGWRTSTRL